MKRKGGRKRIAQAFIAQARSGHRGVFTRKKEAGRLPIGERFSTSVGQSLDDEHVLSEIGGGAQDRFAKELSSQVGFLLR